MSIHLLVAFLGGIVAAAGTVMLAIRFCRAPRIVLAAWALAALGLAVSLGAQALGYHGTFGPGTFRAMQLSAQVLAPLALCLGLAEVAGRTLAARFAARLLLPALALIAFVVLGSDPLSGTAFSVAWPAPSVYYQIIPNKLLEFGLGPVTALVAVLAIGWTPAPARSGLAARGGTSLGGRGGRARACASRHVGAAEQRSGAHRPGQLIVRPVLPGGGGPDVVCRYADQPRPARAAARRRSGGR